MDMDEEIYEECRSIARILMSRSYEGHTLRPTELVHEGLIRIHRAPWGATLCRVTTWFRSRMVTVLIQSPRLVQRCG